MMLPKAAVNFTISTGDRFSPGIPPIVPRMPDMLLINATVVSYFGIAKIRFFDFPL
jgi:hypothetical protein